jgi:dTDP-4-dehydrorhamnose reductase
MKRMLVIGRRGQVASALAAIDWGQDIVVALGGRDEFDLASPAALRDRVKDMRPDLIVNAGA